MGMRSRSVFTAVSIARPELARLPP
jgi:hypothetical protein